MIDFLKQLEKEKNIEIIYACEAGSRAWGVESKQSDYDLRFIYRHKSILSYLSLDHPIEVINVSQPYDIQGWDIKKVFHLLRKSNPSLYEWCFSEVIYIDKQFQNKLRKWVMEHYCPFSLFMHYIHLCTRNYKELQTKTDFHHKSQKQLLYVARSFLIAKRIIHSKSIPNLSLLKENKDELLVNYYHEIAFAKKNEFLISKEKAREILSIIEEEKQTLMLLAENLPKGIDQTEQLNKWLWEILEVND